MAGPDYSGIKAGITQGYDYQRQKAAQQEGANLQGQRDAMARKQAMLSAGGPSGAFIKADQLAGDASAQRLQQANEGINAAQSADLRDVQKTELGQQFQTSERQAGQEFAAGQTKAGQEFQHGERLGSQDFSAAQTKAGQEFSHGERLGSQDFTAGQQQKAQQFQTGERQGTEQFQAGQSKIAQDIQQSQFDKTFGMDQQKFEEQTGVDQFNEKIAQQMADKKDPLETLFGNFSMGNITGSGGLGALGGAGAINGGGVSGNLLSNPLAGIGSVGDFGGGSPSWL